MGLYSAMFWGFSQVLPRQTTGDSPQRTAMFFSVSWVGYLLLADVVFFGQALPGMLGGSFVIGGVVLVILLYAGHVAYFWRSIVHDDEADPDAQSGSASDTRTALGVVFVVVGWCAAFGGVALLRS